MMKQVNCISASVRTSRVLCGKFFCKRASYTDKLQPRKVKGSAREVKLKFPSELRFERKNETTTRAEL